MSVKCIAITTTITWKLHGVHSNHQQTPPTHKITLRAVSCQISVEIEANPVLRAASNDSDKFPSFFSSSLSFLPRPVPAAANTLKLPLVRDEILFRGHNKEKKESRTYVSAWKGGKYEIETSSGIFRGRKCQKANIKE